MRCRDGDEVINYGEKYSVLLDSTRKQVRE